MMGLMLGVASPKGVEHCAQGSPAALAAQASVTVCCHLPCHTEPPRRVPHLHSLARTCHPSGTSISLGSIQSPGKEHGARMTPKGARSLSSFQTGLLMLAALPTS